MSKITMSTSIYGSIFYIATGFHGLHVIVGIILIMCGLQRLVDYRSSADHHIGFELAI
jgi:heme/copper-type cytochrome/quinol oxidase subunit 3